MTLFSELKRRNVLRVAAAYVAVSWLLIQVVETLSRFSVSVMQAFGAWLSYWRSASCRNSPVFVELLEELAD